MSLSDITIPTWLRDSVLAVGLLAIIWLLCSITYHAGYTAGTDHVQALRDADRADAAAAALIDAGRVQTLQAALTDQAAQAEQTKQEALQDAQETYAQRLAAVRTGTSRVLVPVKPGTCTGDGTGLPGTAGVDGDQAHAELTDQAGDDLAAIAREGDTAIIELNDTIGRYNAVRASILELNAARAAAAAQ